MENAKKEVKQIIKFCMPLMNECIRNEVNEYLDSYKVIYIERNKKNYSYNCELKQDNDTIKLNLNIDELHVLKISEHYVEKIAINNDEKWYQRRLEKREKGFIVTDIKKEYGISKRFNNDTVLVDLYEDKYILTNENMKKMLGINDLDNQTLTQIHLATINKNIKSFSDLTTKFSTHMNWYFPWDNRCQIKDNIYPTRTYLNDKEISNIYDLVDGYDKLYRVYYLYNGIINKRNEYDIKSIHLGLLNKNAFDLKTLEGITEQENVLIGESLIPVSNEYKNYLKEFFTNFNNYKDEIKLDRQSVLTAINYSMTLQEREKKHVEEAGVPYDEYQKMEFDEQLRVNSLSYKLIRKAKNFFKNF